MNRTIHSEVFRHGKLPREKNREIYEFVFKLGRDITEIDSQKLRHPSNFFLQKKPLATRVHSGHHAGTECPTECFFSGNMSSATDIMAWGELAQEFEADTSKCEKIELIHYIDLSLLAKSMPPPHQSVMTVEATKQKYGSHNGQKPCKTEFTNEVHFVLMFSMSSSAYKILVLLSESAFASSFIHVTARASTILLGPLAIHAIPVGSEAANEPSSPM
ncbi:hypothetical protein EVAR_101138_1 [Eumeta japonica]|uniref:Uncharacterized protein n=1 Tax=Eumeta variegata TaxID=151549 RepID=A0A4C1SI90_EUMVA|nr:hypothetical protein EVAR_101138_1 [Eumeta japonica]